MKTQWKGFLSGFLSALLVIGFAFPVFAAYQKQATLNFSDIKITLDGKTIEPKDENGNTVEPFTIDGTTYLPIRAIGSALDIEVGWEATAKTVTLKTRTEKTQTPNATILTTSQRDALIDALLTIKHFETSRSGLIEQLKYKKFSTEDATYAADNCGADWNEEAAQLAKILRNYSSLTREKLIERLEYDGFTHEQAVYGADSVRYD